MSVAEIIVSIFGGVLAISIWNDIRLRSAQERKQAREDHQKKMIFWDKKIEEISQRIDHLKIKKEE